MATTWARSGTYSGLPSGSASGRSIWLTLALWTLSCVALVSFSILFLDRPIATWSHDVLHRPAAAVLITRLAPAWVFCGASVAVTAAALVARVAAGRLNRAWRTALAAALATLLATLGIVVLKYCFGRLWPDTWVHNNPSWIGMHQYAFVPFHGGEGWGSFPSGHTARVTAPFTVLWQRLSRFRLVWALPTIVIAGALIASNYHFLGDCIAGTYLGIASAAIVLMLI